MNLEAGREKRESVRMADRGDSIGGIMYLSCVVVKKGNKTFMMKKENVRVRARHIKADEAGETSKINMGPADEAKPNGEKTGREMHD